MRNPFDVIDSYWNMVLTSSHNHSVQERECDRLSAAWAEHMKREAALWAEFHRYWLRAATSVPLLAICFEV